MRGRIENGSVEPWERGSGPRKMYAFVRTFLASQFRCIKIWYKFGYKLTPFSDEIKPADSILTQYKNFDLIFIFSSQKVVQELL